MSSRSLETIYMLQSILVTHKSIRAMRTGWLCVPILNVTCRLARQKLHLAGIHDMHSRTHNEIQVFDHLALSEANHP